MGTLKIRQRVLAPNLDVAGATIGALESRVDAAEADVAAAQADVAADVDVVAAETLIGSFLGAPLYRKVVTIAAGPINQTLAIAHGITGFDTLVRVHGMIKNVGGVRYTLPIPRLDPLESLTIVVSGTNVELETGLNGDYSDYAGHVILEYTKT